MVAARIKYSLVCGLTAIGFGCGIVPAQAQTSWVTVENRSDKLAKIAVPGGKPKRIKPGQKDLRVEIQTTHPNGVDAKAWWVSNPRQLCVIFVRYEGQVVIAGDKNIRCLGH